MYIHVHGAFVLQRFCQIILIPKTIKMEVSMKTKRFLLTACLSLALSFTLSCSSDDNDDGGDNKGGVSSPSGGGGACTNLESVTIGSQIWAKKNLDCDVAGSKCYGNDPANCVKYGRLYDWATAMGLPPNCNSSSCSGQIGSPHRGICPSGWHIPSNDDWDKLYRYADGTDGTSGTGGPYDSPTAGAKLKAESGWNSNGGGTDEFGFSALPGGDGIPMAFSAMSATAATGGVPVRAVASSLTAATCSTTARARTGTTTIRTSC